MKVYDLPETAAVPAPSPHDVYLLRLADIGRGPSAKAALRAALVARLRAWFGPDVALVETPTGPAISHAPWRVSLSYDGQDGWVALGAAPQLGCDAVLVRPFPEMLDVAERYLGPAVAARVRAARLPAETFAHAWAKHEATLKALGLGLQEGRALPPLLCHYHRQTQAVVGVVVG
jgi:phosphopantetheinyl transferase